MADDTTQHKQNGAIAAADLIRSKVAQAYAHEPDAIEEVVEAKSAHPRSKHQEFMYQLSTSGKSLADIQTAWHRYYQDLSDHEKHEVWQEFYDEHSRQHSAKLVAPIDVPKPDAPRVLPPQQTPPPEPHKLQDPRKVSEIKEQLLSNVRSQNAKKPSGHLKSLFFGLSCGFLVVLILLFGFFNERFLAPFITPSKSVSATPIIIDPSAANVGQDPKIIIPKINVEIPVVYTEPSIEDTAVQAALEHGVLHYATTPNPGELGNGVIFGHSSNNILNKGQYKFAFVLLQRLEAGDTFILQKDGKQYVYRVFAKRVVKPSEVGVLNDGQGKPATFTLITCDPPGTSLNRLVVTGEQITPDPATNTASAAPKTTGQPAILPSNSESLWHRLTHWLSD